MFLSTRISHVISELRNKKDLREFIGIKKEEIPKEIKLFRNLKASL